ncbi:MAG: hypothetical protein KDA51_15500, partial [Planctomycetales bacterium]|nr:hypothetical protein [Planctomycetales bacterium]
SNQRRQQDDRDPIEHSLDVFHSKYEGNRTWRVTETRLWKAQKKAGDLWRPLEKQRQQGKSIQGKTQKAHSASCHADTWAKTVRMLERPQSLTFLDRIAKQLAT